MAKGKEKKKRVLSSEDQHKAGVVNFTMEDVKEVQNQQNSVNAKAYELMVEAMAVSANYVGDTISQEGEVRMDDVYPTSLDETMRMDALLDESERAVKDENDEEYNKMIKDLRGIVGWSRRRHFNFSWGIIFGTIITVAAIMYWAGSDQKDKAYAKSRMESIKAWDVKTDTITLEAARDSVSQGCKIDRPIYYKAKQIIGLEESIQLTQEHIVKYTAQADTASTKENRKYYQGRAKEEDKKLAELQKDLEKTNKWSLKDAQKDAYKYAKEYYKLQASAAAFSWFLMIFFVLLIPVYIFANHSWGYVITKHREESELLNKIKEFAFKAAAGLFGAAAALQFFPETRVTTYYSNGTTSTHTESNPLDAIIAALKIGLIIAAICIIALVSTGIMIYSTVVGLKRNYDWKAIYAEAKAKSKDAAAVAADLTNKAIEKRNAASKKN